MTRLKSLFAAAVLAATAAVVPAANAQTVHYVGAGSSAMFQGFAVAAVNDLAPIAGGTVHHWSTKTGTAIAGLKDTRTPAGGSPPPVEFGNFWAVWVDDGAGTPTDVWAYLSVDSTVGVRAYMATPRALLLLTAAAKTTAGTNQIASALFNPPNADEAALPAAVYNALSGTLGKAITAGMTDIRPEDALLATNRSLGTPVDTMPANLPLIYSFALGYGPGPIGAGIKSATGTSTAAATPVAFALPGFSDPITAQPVPTTSTVIPVGESPIVFLVNRKNASGFGQIINSRPASSGIPAYTSDGSYYVRNVWDQHPWPATSEYPSLDQPPQCAGSTTGACHVTRRPVGNLFSGGDCEGDNSAFTWPLQANTQGLRAQIPNGTLFPINLLLREPLSGTMNTTEFSVFKRYGTVNGSNGVSAPFEKPPYISQETNVSPTANNPLNAQCPAKFAESAAQASSTEGKRIRGIGTGEVVNGDGGSPAQGGVLNLQDSLAYAFFSFGNVSKIASLSTAGVLQPQPGYGYLMVDAIDPLFDNYENAFGGTGNVEGEPLSQTTQPATANPGQPASHLTATTWGELPGCSEITGSALPHCTVNGIWGTNPSYPHLRDGSYPAWSELRLICDTAAGNCLSSDDNLGAEALVQSLQDDIHGNHVGGVPDLLPFGDDNSFGPGNGAGDVAFVREHYTFVKANDSSEFNNVAPYSSATTSTVHQSNTQVVFQNEPCSGGAAPGTPKTSPITGECGGDAGGFVVPFGSTLTGNLQ